MNRRRLFGCSLFVVALALLTTGCESATRSGLKKLSEYSYHRFATLDPAAMRVAVQRDARVQVALDRTLMVLYFARGEKTWELARFSPAFRTESADKVPGLPPATQGRSWTLLGVAPVDLARLADLQVLLRLVSSPFYNSAAVGKQLQKMGYDGIPWEGKGKKWINIQFAINFTFAPEGSSATLPVSVWLLLDPKDGYFQFIENAPWT